MRSDAIRFVKNCSFPLVAAMALALPGAAVAAPLTWSLSGTSDGTWSTGATNWTGASGTPWDATNGPNNVAVFVTQRGTSTLSEPVTVNGITISATGRVIQSSTVTLASSGTQAVPVISVTLASSTISSVLEGTAFRKLGTGSLVLSGLNTYSGTTTINGGSVLIDNSSAVGSGPVVINGTAGNQFPRLLLNGTSMTFANNVTVSGTHGQSGAGALHYNIGSGTATLTGTITYLTSATAGGQISAASVSSAMLFTGPVNSTPALNLRIGTFILAGGGSYPSIDLGEGTVRVGANNGIVTTSRFNFQNINSNNSVFDLNGFNQTLSGLTRSGTTATARVYNTSTTTDSTLTLTGSSTFSGSIADFSSTSKKVNLVISGGTHTFTGTSTFTGTTRVDGGLLVFGNATAMPTSAFDTTGSGTLQLASGTTVTLGGLVGGGAFAPVGYGTISSLVLNAQPGSTFTYAGNLADGAAGMQLVKTGTSLFAAAAPGIQVLSGTSQYTGPTRITGGVLQFAAPSALYAGNVGSWTAANLITGSGGGLALNVGGAGEFTTSDVATIAALGSATDGFLPGSFIGIDTTNAGGNLDLATPLADPNGGANSLGLIKLGSGTLTLSAANTYTGLTSVAGGVLAFSGTGGISAASGLAVSSSATLDLTSLSGTGVTVPSLNLSSGGILALGSKTLTFGSAGSSALSGGVVSGAGGLVYTGSSALVVNGSNTIAGPVTLAAGSLMFLQNPYGLGDSAVGTTLEEGSRIYLLSSANSAPIPEPFTVTGSATIQSGNGVAFNLAGPVAVSGTLNLNTDAGAAMTISGSMSGAGTVQKTGGANLTLSNTTSDNTFSGSFLQLGSGTVNVLAASALGAGPAVTGSAAGPINFTNVVGTIPTSLSFAAGSTAGTTLNNVSGTFAGNITGDGGTGGLTKSGTATTILSGTNTYAGTTTISSGGGILRIDAASALPTSGTISIPKGGTSTGYLQLNVAGTNTFTNAFANFASANPPTIGGTPTIQNIQGDTTLTGNMNVGTTGGTGIVVVSDSGLLTLSGTISNTAGSGRPLLLGGSGNGVVSGLITAVSASTSGVNKFGTGTWTITNTANTYTLSPQLVDGVLDVASLANSGVASAIGSGTGIVFSGQGTSATLRYTGATAQATNRTVNVDATGGTIDSSGSGPLTFSGTIQAIATANFNLNFTSGSAVALNNASTQPGTVVGMLVTSTAVPAGTTILAINGNQYTLSNAATATAATNAVFTQAPERTLRLAGSNTGDNTISGPIVSTTSVNLIGVTKVGAGTWILSGSNAYGGTTQVDAGTLLINGDSSGVVAPFVVNGGILGGSGTIGGSVTVSPLGTLAPAGGGIATLTTGSTVSFGDGATFAYDYATSLLTADLLRTSGGLSLSGTVPLSVANLGSDVTVAPGTVFSLVNYGGGLGGGGLFSYGGLSLVEGGTFTVGANTWQIAYSSTTAGVNVATPLPSGSFVNLIAVPEPTAWAMLGSAVAIAVAMRRRST
jgi:fibronectin-binding autotransporter adhesin